MIPALTLFLLLQGTGAISGPGIQQTVIEGRVVSSLTSEVLPNSKLLLHSLSGSKAAVATTDRDGRFVFQGVEPGKYRLWASLPGYVRGEYGARSTNRTGTIVSILAGHHLQNLEVRLTPYGTITGRVLDQDSRTVSGMQVYSFRYNYSRRGRRLVPAWSATTDEFGEYRLGDLIPGRYFIGAIYKRRAATATNGASATEAYVNTYFPSSDDLRGAIPIEIGPGAEFGGINLILLRKPAVRVTGRVISRVTGNGERATVTMAPQDGLAEYSLGTIVGVARQSDGYFEVPNVPQGSYIISVEKKDANQRYFARRILEVGKSEVAGVELVLGAGVKLVGTLKFDRPTDTSLAPTTTSVVLYPKESGLATVTDMVDENGTFQFTDLAPGLYAIDLSGVPGDYYVESLLFEDTVVADREINIPDGMKTGKLTIVLSTGGGSLEGTVVDKRLNFRQATVVLVPEQHNRDWIYLCKTTTTDQYGQFVIRGIPPHEYRILAWEDVEEGAYFEPDFVERFVRKSQTVRISSGSRKVVHLQLIPSGEASGR